MGLAAQVSAAAGEIEAVAAETRGAVPQDWTGRAAQTYQRTATNLASALVGIGSSAHGAAALLHQHERELVAVRTALGANGTVAV